MTTGELGNGGGHGCLGTSRRQVNGSLGIDCLVCSERSRFGLVSYQSSVPEENLGRRVDESSGAQLVEAAFVIVEASSLVLKGL